MQPQGRKIILAVSCLSAILLMRFGSSYAFEENFYGGHLSVVDGSVLVQSATDPELLTAEMNLLVEEGTRIVTANDGRAEVQLAGNDILRLWHDTEIDFIDTEGTVEVWMKLGSVYVRTNSDRSEGNGLKFVTPTATVSVTEGAILRIDVEHEDRTRVTVLEGNAEVFSDGHSASVRSRQMVAVGIARIHGPTRVSVDQRDTFVRWCNERDELLGSPLNHWYSSTEVAAACELDRYGSWVFVPALRVRAWRPRVVVGWSPYRHGRWAWSLRYGWFWVSYEPWGWVPYHYGSWSWCSPWGWLWVPGHTWYGARVSWVVCGDYIGWRPVLYMPDHITGKIPAKHHRYFFVHKTSIARPHTRILDLDKSHVDRHTLVSVKSPSSIVVPPKWVRSRPHKPHVKGRSGEKLAKRPPALERRSDDPASSHPRRSEFQRRSPRERTAERGPETKQDARRKAAGQGRHAEAKGIRISERPFGRAETPAMRDMVPRNRNQAQTDEPPSHRNPGIEVPKGPSNPVADSPRPKGRHGNSAKYASISEKEEAPTTRHDRGSSAGESRSIERPSRHRASPQTPGYGAERKGRSSKSRPSHRTWSQSGRR